MYRYTGSGWTEAVVLGNNAIGTITANKIVSGTIDASIINVSNLNAGNISTGNLDAARIATTALNANNISAGTITGITIKTSGTQRRIEITNEDDMIFYNDSNVKMGTITSVNAGSNTAPGGGSDNIFVDDGILIHGGSDYVDQGTPIFPSIIASSGEVALVGGANTFYANGYQSAIRGSRHNNLADVIELTSGYSSTGGENWRIEFNGPIISDYAGGSSWLGEMLWYGSGAPSNSSNPGKGIGHIVFRYT